MKEDDFSWDITSYDMFLMPDEDEEALTGGQAPVEDDEETDA